MKYLLVILLISNFAYAETSLSVRYRTGKEISHLPIKNDYGLQVGYVKTKGMIFLDLSAYFSKSNLSETQGFTVGLGATIEGHNISYVYFGEGNKETWKFGRGEWVNTNWRNHNIIKYQYKFAIVEYHLVSSDRDELLEDRIYLGVKFNYNDYFVKAHSDGYLTTFNIGFTF